MAYKSPINAPLTENQARAISKLSAVNTFLSATKKTDKNVPKNQQISTYDFLLQMAISIIGPPIVDVLLKTFFNKVFNAADQKLEKIVITAIAKSLDKNEKQISNSQSNEDWLFANVLPTFKLAKNLLAAQIIAMIFGPKQKMEEYLNRTSEGWSAEMLTLKKNKILESAVCANRLFSLANNIDDTQGNIEYNQVELKKQLEQGNVEFIISCQNVKVKLPDDTDAILGTNTVINPADMFTNLSNYVSGEIQRQNSEENANAVNKSFLQTVNEKMFNLMPETIGYQLNNVVNTINNNSNLALTIEDITSYPCEIVGVCYESDSENYKRKTAFSSHIMNTLYALLITILFREITNRIKKILKQAIAERARRRRERVIEKQRQRFSFLNKAGESLSKATKFKEALKEIDDIFDAVKNI